jgi:nucleoid DNA-binding protein
MNKQEFSKVAALKTGMTQAKAVDMFEIFMGIVEEYAMSEGKVTIGPWTWKKKVSPERLGRDPRNSNVIKIPTKVALVQKKAIS